MGKYAASCWAARRSPASLALFHFEKPDGFSFTPGESINLLLPEDFPGVGDDRQRALSLVIAPHEDRLTIATACARAPTSSRSRPVIATSL
ncbi:MAG: hypothetical protein ACRECX_13225 [Methyloceanibacter sp.]|uniref:hypothetical protein n=1 Tax=Methyloceanibacter sp. TaxID=1965321 RepID=UPI003D6D90B3